MIIIKPCSKRDGNFYGIMLMSALKPDIKTGKVGLFIFTNEGIKPGDIVFDKTDMFSLMKKVEHVDEMCSFTDNSDPVKKENCFKLVCELPDQFIDNTHDKEAIERYVKLNQMA